MDESVAIDINTFDAAIFDMDGTMINNMTYHKKAWKEFAKRHGFELTDEEFKEKCSGKKNDQIFKSLLGKNLTAVEIAKYTDEKESIYRQLYMPQTSNQFQDCIVSLIPFRKQIKSSQSRRQLQKIIVILGLKQ